MDKEVLVQQLVIKAYEHHKSHARFEETQRSWFLAAYLTFTGLLINGALNVIKDEKNLSEIGDLLIVFGLVNLTAGICTAFAIMKVTGEFRRHNRRAEDILKYIQKNSVDKFSYDLLSIATLDTATHAKKLENRVTAFFSVAAMHNYILSMFISMDIVLIFYILFDRLSLVLSAIIWIITFLTAARLQHLYLRYVQAQQESVEDYPVAAGLRGEAGGEAARHG